MEAKNYLVLAYYYYTPIDNPEEFTVQHLKYCKEIGLRGRIYIAHEGINGTVSGPKEVCELYMNDLKADPRFAGIEFKVDEYAGHAFNRMHVRVKTEIVHSGLRDPNVIDPNKETGKHLRGEEFLALKDRDDVVILDVRSNYETRIGKFKNSVTLDMENFREFPDKIAELEKYKWIKYLYKWKFTSGSGHTEEFI